MQNTIMDVRDVPDLIVSKLRSNTISWREENGELVFKPAKPVMPVLTEADIERRKAAWERLSQWHRILPKDFDYEKEKAEWMEEKYGRIL